MQLSGPGSVREGGSITVTAHGVGAADTVKFEVAGDSGNTGFDVKNTHGSDSVSYTESMSFEGAERIVAYAQDKFLNVIGKAAHPFKVLGAAGRVGDDGPGVGGGYIVSAPRQVQAMGPWSYTISGLKDVHSVLVELYGANGGMFRIFPRGRDVMQHAIVPAGLGRTQVMMMFRDAHLRTLHTLAGEIDVVPQPVSGPGAGGGYEPVSSFGPLAPMGPKKPPVAFSAKAVSPYAAMGGAQSGTMAPLRSSGSAGAPTTAEELAKQKEAELLARLSKKK